MKSENLLKSISLEKLPHLSLIERLLNKILPSFLQSSWNFEALLANELKLFKPHEYREEIKIIWIYNLNDITSEINNFFRGVLGKSSWFLWRYRIISSKWLVVVAYWEGKPAAYIVIQYYRKDKMRYGKVMHPDAAFVGPAYTAPFARGKKIYSYLMSVAFGKLKEAGIKWAYGCVGFENEASIKGIEKFGYYRYVGMFLLHKFLFFRVRVSIVSIEFPEAILANKK